MLSIDMNNKKLFNAISQGKADLVECIKIIYFIIAYLCSSRSPHPIRARLKSNTTKKDLFLGNLSTC
jgi:hypothetical protein